MENHFTFLKSPELTALKHALDLMPGLMQVDLIVNNDLKKEFSVYRLQEKNGEIQKLEIHNSYQEESRSFISTQKNMAWYQKEDLPYFGKTHHHSDTDLFSELDKNILLIPIRNIPQLPHLFYIFLFRKNASELGPVSNKSVLDTSHKQLMARLISNSLKGMLHSIIENRKVMLEYNRMLSSLIQSKEIALENQNVKTKQLNAYLQDVLMTFVSEVKEENEDVYLSEKTQQILFPHLSNPSYLKEQLKKALNFARTFHFLKQEGKLELLPEYFNDLKKVEHPKQINKSNHNQNQSDLYSSHTKTYQFLQSLEDAATRLLHKGNKLTSMNVGQELSQPITAAAISDKLKNHAYKIHLLFKQYPDKWPIVRNQFKPVINIEEKQSREKYAS